MALAALDAVRPAWVDALGDWFHAVPRDAAANDSHWPWSAHRTEADGRDLAHTAQHVLQSLALGMVEIALDR